MHLPRILTVVIVLSVFGISQQVKEITPEVGPVGPQTYITFLDNELLLVTNGQQSPISEIGNVTSGTIVSKGRTCAGSASLVAATSRGNILASCPNKVAIYSCDFKVLREIPSEIRGNALPFLITPEHDLIAGRAWGKRVLSIDELKEVSTISRSDFIEALLAEGYIRYNSATARIEFVRYSRSSMPITIGGTKCCEKAYAIGGSEIYVAGASPQHTAAILDATTGNSRIALSEKRPPAFIATSTGGRRFAVGFQTYSKVHGLKLFNPMELLATAYGDDPADVTTIAIFDQVSGKKLQEFHWKPTHDEPLFNRYYSGAVSISPNGSHMAYLRGNRVLIVTLDPS